MKIDTGILDEYREHLGNNYQKSIDKLQETLNKLSEEYEKADAKSKAAKAEEYIQNLIDLMNQHMLKAKWPEFEAIKSTLIEHGIKLDTEDDGRWFWRKPDGKQNKEG